MLGGLDPEPDILGKKIEELELRLAEKEEKLLEKDLIYEEVSRLAERTKGKAETGKEDTLQLAKKVTMLFLPIWRDHHYWYYGVFLRVPMVLSHHDLETTIDFILDAILHAR